MKPQTLASALSTLPRDANIQQVEIFDATKVRVHYDGVSAGRVETAGWNHVDSTDYYGVAVRDTGRSASNNASTGLDLGF